MKELPLERDIWLAFKAGDRKALGQIFECYYPLLHHYGRKMCQNSTLTEDVLQDFFLYLYEHRQSLKDLDSLKAYLFASFRRRLLRHLKRIEKERHTPLHEVTHASCFVAFSKEELLIEAETSAIRHNLLIDSLNQLPQRQREVLYLRYYNQMSLEEISTVMEISKQGAANTLYKAFKFLRKNANIVKIKDLSISLSLLGIHFF